MKIFMMFSRLSLALPLAAVFGSAQLLCAQGATADPQSTSIAQQDQQPPRALPPDDPDVHEKAFTGVIVRSGDKLVLLDTISKTSYQLDDQEKAKDFLNKNVRVTGVLNPASGTIHVTAIDMV